MNVDFHFTRLKDNIKIELKETAWEGVDWIYMNQVRDEWWVLANLVMNFQVL